MVNLRSFRTGIAQTLDACYRLGNIEGKIGRDAVGDPGAIEIEITGDLKEKRHARLAGIASAHRGVTLAHLLVDDVRLELAQRTPQIARIEKRGTPADPLPRADAAYGIWKP